MNTTVNFEIGKVLKEKGFDEPCNHVHYENKTYAYTKSGGVRNSHKKEQQWVCTAPTIAEVVMWLYDKHGIWICVYTMDKWMSNGNDKEQLFDYGIKQMKLGLIDIPKKPEEFNSPTEAYGAAIEYTLKHLI